MSTPRNLVRPAGPVVSLHDHKGQFLWVSDYHPGFSPGMVIGTSPWKWTHGDDLPAVQEAFAAAAMFDRTTTVRFRVIGPDEFVQVATIHPINTPDRVVSCVLAWPVLPIRLSAREHQVLDLLCRDLSVSEIAKRLKTKGSTVSTQIRSLRKKFSVKTTYGLVAMAIKYRLPDLVDRQGLSPET
jgi:DNA-binding CsgD family transcriptional regulator